MLMNATVDNLFRLVQEYSPLEVGIEITGQQGGFISWIQNEMTSRNIYLQAIEKFPTNRLLQLDYANKLAESARLNEAEQRLKVFINLKNKYEFTATKTLAKVYFWQGRYDIANTTIKKALQLNNTDKEAKEIEKNIDLARKHWAAIDFSYNIDDQPQSAVKPKAEFGYYINDFATVGAKTRLPVFFSNASYLDFGFSAFNTLNFHKLKAKSYIELGFDKLPNNKIAFNGSLLLNKHIYKYLSAEINTSYKPYLLTNTSLDMNIMELKYGLDFIWNNPNGFMAKAGFNINQFPSFNNLYYTGSAWLMSPKLKVSFFDFRIGYGFSYSDAKVNTYETKDSLQGIIDNSWNEETNTFEPLTNIDGYYNPFFTPSKQMVNSAIVSINAKPIKPLNINLTGSFGFYSITDNPSLNLEYEEGKETEEYQGAFIKTYFSKEQYFPLDIGAKVSYDILQNFNTGVYYNYLSTKYYKSHQVGINAKYLF